MHTTTIENNVYLFSVDLEDVRFWMNDGLKYKERVPDMTARYSDFLDEHQCKTTFFIVGDVARAYPHLINKIAERGHEIACHSNEHIPLDKYEPSTFKSELKENIKVLKDKGAENIYGFRAPIYSITEKTKWVYDILSELGFVYSSSVFPAKNPLYGWPEFGREMKLMNGNIWELPITIYKSLFISFPFAGGIYFRLLPLFISRKMFQTNWNKGLPVIGYFHPYDIDYEQERFMHPGINDSRFYNKLMYVNRKSLLDKFSKIVSAGANIMPYIDYINKFKI